MKRLLSIILAVVMLITPASPMQMVDAEETGEGTKVYTVTFDANGGTDAPEPQTKLPAQTIELTSEIPVREGYIFKGWSDAVDGKINFKAGALFARNADTTLYAIWKAETYLIQYDANGGEGATASQIKTYGTEFYIKTTKPVREGYRFLGWSESADGEVTYLPGDAYTKNEETTLYAVWELKTYTVKFNSNGGKDSPEDQVKEYGNTLELSSLCPSRSGYEFLGWSSDKTATEPEYQPGGEYTDNSNITLYAIWKKNVYTITFDANGGEKAPQPQTKEYAQSVELTTAIPVREGYIFQGWSDAADGKVIFKAGAVFARNSDTVLYAVWKIETYHVQYDPNGGEGATASQIKTYGTDINIKATKPVREGYRFLGWSESADGEVTYLPGDAYTKNEEITLYAVWELKTYTVKFNSNGGKDSPEDQVKEYGITLELSGLCPSRSGYEFLGWSSDKTATEPEYQPGGEYKENANITLYAVWKKNVYTITFDANGGEKAPQPQTKEYAQSVELTTAIPVREGYIFQGWSDAADGKVIFKAGALFARNSDTVLYAVWKLETYEIKYDPNGGEGATASQIKKYGTDLVLKTSKPSREGYKFIGWSEEKDGEVVFLPGDTYTKNEATTLYAVWQIRVYTVYYNTNGGINPPEAQKKDYGSTLVLSESSPARLGYDFLGWSTDKAATESMYLPGDEYADNVTITLYAIWKIKVFTVTFDANGGEGGPAAFTKEYGEIVTLSSELPVRKGYVFQGWSDAPDGKVHYKAGALFARNENKTLYALWKAEVYTINYKGNGTMCAIGNQEKTFGQTLILTTKTPNRPGYTFVGWSTDKTAKTAEYYPGDKFNVEGNTTLYAIWATEVYTITFDGNGGACNINPMIKVKGEDLIIDADKTGVPTRDGYFCIGWSASENATDPEYSVVIPETLTIDADCTLYAVWYENPFKDVAKNKWYQKYIGYVYYRQAMTGRSADEFAWWDNLTRGETVTLLYKSDGKPEPESETSVFSDVTRGFALKPIIWAQEMGIITGRSDGTFGPSECIKRQDFIKILYEYAVYKGYDVSVTSDSSYMVVDDWADTSKYARPMVNWGYEMGFIGNGSNLNPKENITRAQAATIISRFLRKYRP